MSTQYQGRGWTKDLPARLAQRLERAMKDSELTSLAAEIALMDARVGELFARAEMKEGVDAWLRVGSCQRSLLVVLARLASALTDGAVEDGKRALEEARGLVSQIEQAVTLGAGERATWGEIHETVRTRKDLVLAELKREEQLDATMSARQAMQLITALQIAIAEEVLDPEQRKRVARRVESLLTGAPRGEPLALPPASDAKDTQHVD